MVLTTRTSAPNTSLAVIRPKPRPDSPTASEISVIMLKSELPHEAPNPVSKKETRVHQLVWRHGCRMVACGTCAGVGDDAGDRSDDSDLAANRIGARKTCRQVASGSSIERQAD